MAAARAKLFLAAALAALTLTPSLPALAMHEALARIDLGAPPCLQEGGDQPVKHASGSGLFLSRDPLGFDDSANLYAGMRHDPVTLRDPTGRAIPSPELIALNHAKKCVKAAAKSLASAVLGPRLEEGDLEFRGVQEMGGLTVLARCKTDGSGTDWTKPEYCEWAKSAAILEAAEIAAGLVTATIEAHAYEQQCRESARIVRVRSRFTGEIVRSPAASRGMVVPPFDDSDADYWPETPTARPTRNAQVKRGTGPEKVGDAGHWVEADPTTLRPLVKVKSRGLAKTKDDVPDDARGEVPYLGESGRAFAERVLRRLGRFNPGDVGPGSEFNKIKKYADNDFEDPRRTE